jgi:hypothetical protein
MPDNSLSKDYFTSNLKLNFIISRTGLYLFFFMFEETPGGKLIDVVRMPNKS